MPGAFQLDRELDAEAFGADRATLVERLAADGAVSLPQAGYAMGRSGSDATYFGPCVSRSPLAVRLFLEWLLHQHSGEKVYWDLLPENQEAAKLASEFGFERQRQLVRMVLRGSPDAAPLRFDNSLVFAIAGFEYG